MIITKKVEIAWSPSNKHWFQEKGYIFTKRNDKFEVNIEDLMPQSAVELKALCDGCNKSITKRYNQVSGKLYEKTYCNSCSASIRGKSRRLKYEDVKYFIEVESGSGCKLISQEYRGYDGKLDIICKCGNKFKTTFSEFKHSNKRQCNKCGLNIRIEIRSKTNEQFKKEVYEMVGDEYEFLEGYKGALIKILCKHNIDNCDRYEWYITPDSFLSGTRCPKCAGNAKKTDEEFKKEVYELVGGEYTFLEEYKGARVKIKCRHNVDDCSRYEWDTSPNNFLTGYRCPRCNESKGEQQIRKYLEDSNIKYKREYSFDGLLGVGGLPLRFDFAIFNNDKLGFLIEYDGEFHFNKYYDAQNFEMIQLHDKHKNQYCKDNNIPLLRIPYWKFDNIEEILNEWTAILNI